MRECSPSMCSVWNPMTDLHQPPAGSDSTLAREERRAWTRALSVAGPTVLMAVFVAPRIGRIGWLVVACGVGPAAVFTLVGYYTGVARRGLRQGCREVLVVGWTRIPDGCNFAVFPADADPHEVSPEFVLRIPTLRDTAKSLAWLCGTPKRSRFHALALLRLDGVVLGIGRVRSDRSSRKVWARRHSPTPRWIGGPPSTPPDV